MDKTTKERLTNEFMQFVQSLSQENAETILKEEGYTCNVEKYQPDHYIMRVWVRDTEHGRELIQVADQQMWNVDVRYRKWCAEMMQYYREGYTVGEAYLKSDISKGD